MLSMIRMANVRSVRCHKGHLFDLFLFDTADGHRIPIDINGTEPS